METLPRALLRTPAGQAAVTLAWLEGIEQRRIARAFGYANPTQINQAINLFITAYFPDAPCDRYWGTMPMGTERKPLGNVAIMRYLEARGH